MGKNSRIAELERQVEFWKKKAHLSEEIRNSLEKLCNLPEDSTLLYTEHGMRIVDTPVKWAKIYREKICQE